MFNIFKSNSKKLGIITVALSSFGIPYIFQNNDEIRKKCKVHLEKILFEKNVSSIEEALKNVANKYRIKEAINYLEFFFPDKLTSNDSIQLINAIDNTSLCLLALSKSKLVPHHKIAIDSLRQMNEVINDKDLDAEYDNTFFVKRLNKIFKAESGYFNDLHLLSIKVCESNYLGCFDKQQRKTYKLKTKNIINALIRGVMATEAGDCRIYATKELIDILFLIFINNRNTLVNNLIQESKIESRKICSLTIKILSNIAKNDKDCGDLIVNSEWFIFLSKMITEPISDEEVYWSRKVFHNILYSYKYETNPIPCDMVEIYSPPNDVEPIVDVVFIHGLRGGGLLTWRSHDSLIGDTKTKCWPADWLLPEINIPIRGITTDYLSSFWYQKVNASDVTKLVTNLDKQFHEAGIGKRPVIFIAHSLGGILLKQILINNPEIRKKTLSVLFIAVPHRGSPLSKFFGKLPLTSNEVKFLKPCSESISKVHNDFLNICENIPLFMSLSETKKDIVMISQMVPAESAYFEKGAFYHTDKSHTEITKPKDKSDIVYILVKKFITDSLINLKKLTY
uniref:Protein SERAC1 (inferred by orthology to a human protein) n=1 Tax=Strongyloides venezuelensis TaxID=75913 RepID=A0A0K0FFW8_STRVS